jgi:hypothetical protein
MACPWPDQVLDVPVCSPMFVRLLPGAWGRPDFGALTGVCRQCFSGAGILASG